MTRGKQKIEDQKRAQEKNAPKKGSQIESRAAAFKLKCHICLAYIINESQVAQHYENKHAGKPVTPLKTDA
ncbi:hypothetical protein CYY_000691 [Polysphondylium violaceum]|uniref:C2H2-type domain-containing protein n=1 Tax=Polysphondylium violaceum TaxID=133409 RepID=A0A8J4Q490_9MYCE|nr:hypothetical protein CYY_000691 [Polysphondylium violaceum]